MTLNTNRIIELSLVFFISLFSFSIGTFVGKKYSDNQHRLSQLEPNKKIENHSETADTETHAATGEHGEAPAAHEAKTETHGEAKAEHSADGEITDADVAKLAEEFANQPETTVKKEVGHAKTETHEANTHASTTHSTPAHAVAAKPVEKDVKEISTHDASNERDIASVPAKVSAMVAINQYTVQVGSYPEEAEAKKVSESLVARGYKANTVSAQVKGKTWYRVQVGQFKTTAEAQDYKKELMEKNRLTSAIVQKITPTE